MDDQRLDALLRMTEDSTESLEKTLEKSQKYNYTKRKMNGICSGLTKETKKYEPRKTVESITAYIESNDKLDRILYSEISNYVYSLEMKERGIVGTNLENLLLYSLDDNNAVNSDCKKIIVKIYDHFQLSLHQIENANNIIANSIEDAKENLKKEIKGVEKEYISILGIFASIVLAFVGGITFSTSVLQNISTVSAFRLFLVIDFLAFVLINVIYILIKFIYTINEKDTKLFNIKLLNVVCLLVAIFIVIAWFLNINQIPGFISRFLPWSR